MFQVYDCVYMSLLQLLHDSKRKALSDGTVPTMRFDNDELSVAMYDVDDVDGPIAIRKGTLIILSYIYSVLWLTDIVLK